MHKDLDYSPSLTPKGARTSARIVQVAAQLIHKNGVAATSLDEVKAAAQVSSSQLSHYFGDKRALVQAVIDHQAVAVVEAQMQCDLSTLEGLRAWRETVIAEARRSAGKGGCPLGALGSQLAETDDRARIYVAAGFDRWSDAIRLGLRRLHADGKLAPGIDPESLSETLLVALQGGLLLTQVHRDTQRLETTLDTILALAVPTF